MSKFFINRPIVAMVIAIIMVIVGVVALSGLPISQYPDIVPPEMQIQGTYTGADALTVEQSVATPIEQQMSGVDNMKYMYSLNSNDGKITLRVNFAVGVDANTAQVLTQMRKSQAEPQLPSEVKASGVTVVKSTAAPFMLVNLFSPDGSRDAEWLANYANINVNDAVLRVPGIGQTTVFGAGQYAMRIWVNPDRLASLNITVPEVIDAVQKQNTVNPAGQLGAEPAPPGTDFTYAVSAQGRLVTAEEFGNVVVRANTDGSLVRLKDVSRIELGAQTYTMQGRLDGKPAAVLALYQLPGSNAIQAADGVRKLMAEQRKVFPAGLDYKIALDTTKAVSAGIEEIISTLWEAIILVVIVVFIFLQGWRATLIPLLAVPVSLIATFALFPLLGFSINTLSLFGLVLAIGIVVDDAIVVVEAVEHHIEHGLSPKDATIKAMEEVSGPVVAIALILTSVFVPTVFIPGITGRLYQQFAVTIAASTLFSAFNALTLSPALAAMLLKPKTGEQAFLDRWINKLLGGFFRWFNRIFGIATDGYVSVCRLGIRRISISLTLLLGLTLGAVFLGKSLPASFLPEEDQGYFYINVSLPEAASLQRTSEVCKKVEAILAKTPGVEAYTTVAGYSLINGVASTYNGFFFVTLKDWAERKSPETQYNAIVTRVNQALSGLPEARSFAFSPPAIPGIGTSGGVTFILEDRVGESVGFLAEKTKLFIEEARKRPEIASVTTTLLAAVPQLLADVDRDKVMKQGIDVSQLFRTLQTFMGGYMVNFFNRFGRQWQVFVQAEGDYRVKPEQVGQFSVRNKNGEAVPLSSVVTMKPTAGPEFTLRYNLYRSAQINASAKPGFSSAQVMRALEDVYSKTMPTDKMGYDYLGMSFQEAEAQKGVSPMAIFALSLLFVFLILAAQYESWSLPFAVLLGTPIAVFGAFLALFMRGMENNVYAQIGLVVLIGLAAKNAILIVEFARAEASKGGDLMEAALTAAKVRLRPILMTAFAFILGCVPLWVATGSGSVSRQVLGTAVIGGMLCASLVAIFIIPASFYLVERLVKGKRKA